MREERGVREGREGIREGKKRDKALGSGRAGGREKRVKERQGR